jgi:peptidoglycan/LPS O-acetylase OafA/YrhL
MGRRQRDAPDPEAAAAFDPARSEAFRPDIEGMRGVAVLLVVLFHAGLAGVAGGFIGVDVFFVISGFLITGLLLRERERTGSVDLVRFYARRARRILPAAVVVIAITLPVAVLVLDPLSRAAVIIDGLASALSIGNIRFADVAGDYFSSAGTSSPFLHFWSLGVEEQFYLIWPVLLILAGRSRRPRIGIGLVLGGVVVTSLVAEVVVTNAAVNWAFYSLPTRAWQLAIGGLLAVATMSGGVRLPWSSAKPAGSAKPARSPHSAKPARSVKQARSVRSAKPARSGTSAKRATWSPELSAAVLAIVGWLGLAGVLWSAWALDESIAYPGAYALVPTLGAAAMIVAGASRYGPRFALGLPPLRFLGRISYSLYLWHWPLLVLPAVALGTGELGAGNVDSLALGAVGTGAGAITTELDWWVRLGLVAVSIAIATVSCLAVEEPFRRNATLASRPRRTLGLAFATLVTVVGLGGALVFEVSQQFDGPAVADFGGSTSPAAAVMPGEAVGATNGEDAIRAPIVVLAGSAKVPARGGSPSAAPTPFATLAPARPKPADRSFALPADIRPSLSSAHNDRERLWADGCLAYEAATTPPACVYGDRSGRFSVALVGDSHGAQWFPTFERVAQLHHWRLVVFTKVSCPFIDMPIWSNALKREYTECATWDAAVVAKLAGAPPDLTIVAMSHWIYPLRSTDGTVPAEAAALAREIALVPGHTAIMVDTPHAAGDVPGCLAKHRSDIRPCATPRSTAFSGHGLVERAAAKLAGVATIDLDSAICPVSPCPSVVHGLIVYRDYHHLTATFSASLAPELDQALSLVIGQR